MKRPRSYDELSACMDEVRGAFVRVADAMQGMNKIPSRIPDEGLGGSKAAVSSVRGAKAEFVRLARAVNPAVELLRHLARFESDLTEAIACPMPKVGDDELDAALLEPSISDEGFAKAVAEAQKDADRTKRLAALTAALKRVMDEVKRRRSRAEMLDRRIKADPESQEAANAKILKGRILKSVDVLRKRRDILIQCFMRTRKNVLKRLVAETTRLDMALPGGAKGLAVHSVGANDITNSLRLLEEMDAKHRKSRWD